MTIPCNVRFGWCGWLILNFFSLFSMLERPDFPTLARVMRVQPRADETPVPGFSWDDYGDVVEESFLVHDADQEDEGEWGVVKSRNRTRNYIFPPSHFGVLTDTRFKKIRTLTDNVDVVDFFITCTSSASARNHDQEATAKRSQEGACQICQGGSRGGAIRWTHKAQTRVGAHSDHRAISTGWGETTERWYASHRG